MSFFCSMFVLSGLRSVLLAVCSHTIQVGHLAYTVRQEDILPIVEECGPVASLDVRVLPSCSVELCSCVSKPLTDIPLAFTAVSVKFLMPIFTCNWLNLLHAFCLLMSFWPAVNRMLKLMSVCRAR